MHTKLKNQRRSLGQGLVEYILITALVSLAAVVIFRSFRSDLEKAYQKVGQSIVSGVESSEGQGGNLHD